MYDNFDSSSLKLYDNLIFLVLSTSYPLIVTIGNLGPLYHTFGNSITYVASAALGALLTKGWLDAGSL